MSPARADNHLLRSHHWEVVRIKLFHWGIQFCRKDMKAKSSESHLLLECSL